ncbi:MAG TPA: hypothetical protein VGR11_16920 [Solirubrobacteraceae bacterium]|nr:hypothetical protein [Solirubrobacteraceae bacterium]
MGSRIVKVTMLAVASLMLSSGAAFAASALSTDTNASAAQYGAGAENAPQALGGSNPGPAVPVQNVLGETDEGSVAPVKSAGNGPGPDVAGAVAAQAPRQLAAASGSDASRLPFTGIALIPILLFGVALLALGLVLRRRSGTSGVPA